MTDSIDKITDTIFLRPKPLIFRGAACVLALCVATTDRFLGGSWFAVLLALLLVGVTTFVLPASAPKTVLRKEILALLRWLRISRWGFQLSFAILMISAAVFLDIQLGGITLGPEFNIYLIPVFLASLFFGVPLALLTWLLCFLAVYFCLIPPRYSFEILSLGDFRDLMTFFYLGLMTAAVPTLIRASSVADDSFDADQAASSL